MGGNQPILLTPTADFVPEDGIIAITGIMKLLKWELLHNIVYLKT